MNVAFERQSSKIALTEILSTSFCMYPFKTGFSYVNSRMEKNLNFGIKSREKFGRILTIIINMANWTGVFVQSNLIENNYRSILLRIK